MPAYLLRPADASVSAPLRFYRTAVPLASPRVSCFPLIIPRRIFFRLSRRAVPATHPPPRDRLRAIKPRIKLALGTEFAERDAGGSKIYVISSAISVRLRNQTLAMRFSYALIQNTTITAYYSLRFSNFFRSRYHVGCLTVLCRRNRNFNTFELN